MERSPAADNIVGAGLTAALWVWSPAAPVECRTIARLRSPMASARRRQALTSVCLRREPGWQGQSVWTVPSAPADADGAGTVGATGATGIAGAVGATGAVSEVMLSFAGRHSVLQPGRPGVPACGLCRQHLVPGCSALFSTGDQEYSRGAIGDGAAGKAACLLTILREQRGIGGRHLRQRRGQRGPGCGEGHRRRQRRD